MGVTRTRVSQCPDGWRNRWPGPCAAAGRNCQQRLNCRSNFVSSETVIAVPALRFHQDQPAFYQLGQVAARGLGTDMGRERKLAGGQRFAAEKLEKHDRPGRITDQACGGGKILIHLDSIARPCARYYGRHRNVAIRLPRHAASGPRFYMLCKFEAFYETSRLPRRAQDHCESA